ncbi:hypothetical protein FA204_33930 [Pseudomonas aeruginosa]|nr:hypothetical protein [Pseudomonas aeruginosa]
MAACAVIDANGFVTSTSEPTCSSYLLLTPSEFAAVQAAAAPFDYTQAFAFWSFAFGTVLLFWLTARGVGTILNLIRRR